MTYAYTDRPQVEESYASLWFEHDEIAITLTPSQWRTIRLALLLHSLDCRDGICDKNPRWADAVADVHKILRDALPIA